GNYAPLEAIGDLVQMLDELSKKAARSPDWLSDLPLIQQGPTDPPGPALSPLRVIEELRSIFPRDGIATCDVGSHKLVMGQFWRSYKPGTFFMSNGLSGMGFGVPAAIAAQLCHPEKPVLAVV